MSSAPQVADGSPRVMNAAAVRPVRATPLGQTATMQQYTQTLFWTFAAIGVCVLAYCVEKYIVRDMLGWITDTRYRMFKNPAELPMRLFGLPHFAVGLLFMLSSKRMRGVKSWAQLAGLAAIGGVFCWLFYRYGYAGDRFNALALLLFYFYFLIHGFRDEAFFYKAYGDMPRDAGRTHDRIMVVLQLLMLGLLLSLAIPAYVLFGQLRPEFSHPLLENLFPADWGYATRFASTFLPMVAIAWLALWRIARVFPDGLAGLWRTHQPILTVFLIGTGIILIALVSGPWTFNAVVLMHFVGWYIFGRQMLARGESGRAQAATQDGAAGAPTAAAAGAPAAAAAGARAATGGGREEARAAAGAREATRPQPGTWKWMRTTRTGFTWLHLGLAAIVVLLVAWSTYVDGKSGPLEAIVGSKSFYYWTIMHVTLSFYPR